MRNIGRKVRAASGGAQPSRRNLSRSWADAEATAQQLADLAGVALGEPVTISETFSSLPPPISPVGDIAFAAAEATPIEPGQQQVAVTLTVRFAIDG